MPILENETTCHPGDLLDTFAEAEAARRWWVLHTRPRQEKSIGRDLLTADVPFYLPQLCKTVLYRGRRQRSFLPIFTGYVFLFGHDEERLQALATNRLVQVLRVPDQDGLLHDLRQLKRLIETRTPLEFEKRLQPGRRVRVRAGSLMGLEGTVLHHKGSARLVVAVRFLQQGVSMEIEDVLLEPLE